MHQQGREIVFLKDVIHLVLPFSGVFVAAKSWLCLSWAGVHSVLALKASRSDYYNTLGRDLPRKLMWESKSPLTGNGSKRWTKHCSGHNGVEPPPSPVCESTPAPQCFIYLSRAFCSQCWYLLQKMWSGRLTVLTDSPFGVTQTKQEFLFFLVHFIFSGSLPMGIFIHSIKNWKQIKLLSVSQYYVDYLSPWHFFFSLSSFIYLFLFLKCFLVKCFLKV